ncbi:MAG: 8-amino-7-oxononanoate synthase [Pseudomonadota bacterium]|jgi:8-amino-7-oxononanoate synthase
MTGDLTQALRPQLDDWAERHLLRQTRQVQVITHHADLDAEAGLGSVLSIDGQAMLSFGSNDYLGLAHHPEVVAAAQEGAALFGAGAMASALVCGHHAPHEALELALAAHVGLPQALSFHSGYAANVGVIPALVGPQDEVFSDALNHACLIDGIRLSKARATVWPHRDLAGLAQALAASTARRKLIVTDAVFSMDGALADVPALLALCERHDAWLMVDDAHGYGVLGAQGQGSLAHHGLVGEALQAASSRLIYMATLGKAAGVAGAFVAGQPALIDWLRQRARTYMFATAPPPMLATALCAAIGAMQAESWRRERLSLLRAQLIDGVRARALPWTLMPSPTPIQPLVVGSNADAMRLMAALAEQGVWVPAIRPPTVPEGTARLRISLTAAHSPRQVTRLLDALSQAQPATAS